MNTIKHTPGPWTWPNDKPLLAADGYLVSGVARTNAELRANRATPLYIHMSNFLFDIFSPYCRLSSVKQSNARRQGAKVGKLMMKTRKPKILRVWIEHRPDQDPDTSHMGEYASKPASQFAIDRAEQGDMNRNEFRWFNPSFNYVDANGNPEDGLTPDLVRKYVQKDYRRMEHLQRGDWHYIGVIAKAEVQLTGDAVQILHSGGLWGVESDSGDYLNEVAKEELAGLRNELEAVGLGNRAIDRAFSSVETIAR